jgi:hypothetical protein
MLSAPHDFQNVMPVIAKIWALKVNHIVSAWYRPLGLMSAPSTSQYTLFTRPISPNRLPCYVTFAYDVRRLDGLSIF